MNLLRLSTAVNKKLGPFLDSADGATAETGLSIGQTDILLSKQGGVLGQTSDSSPATSHDQYGWYNIPLTATDTNRLGELKVVINMSGALPFWETFTVVPTNVYDSFISGTDYMAVDAFQIAGDTTSASNLANMYNGVGYIDDAAPSTQSQVGSIAIGAGGLSSTAVSATIVSGSETNSYLFTEELGGIYHTITPSGGNTNFYYEFNLGSEGEGTSVVWNGYAQGNNNTYAVYAYDWISSAWKQIGTINGTNTTTQIEREFVLTTRYTGLASSVGKVRIKFESVDGSLFATDRILCQFTSLPGGISNGSTVTLTESTNNTNLIGRNWILNLGGQDIGGSYFYQSTYVYGTGTCANANANTYIFQECNLINPTLSACGFIENCAVSNSLTFTSTSGASDDFIDLINVVSAIPGGNAPTIDLSNTTKTTSLNIRKWSGGLKLNVNQYSTVSVDVVSGGTITINGASGTVNIRGMVEGIVDNTNGTATITQVAAINRSIISNTVWDEPVLEHSGVGSVGQTLWLASDGDATSANQTIILNNLATVSNNVDALVANSGDFAAGGATLANQLTILSAVNTGVADLRDILYDVQGVSFSTSTDSLSAIRDRGDAAWISSSGSNSNGNGARAITVTVDDGTTNLEGAKVRYYRNVANNFINTTDSTGVATFSLDDATYTVSIALAGYEFTPTTHAVSLNESVTYSMSAVNISASDLDKTTGYVYTLDENNDAESGVTIRCRLKTLPSGNTGYVFDARAREVISDANGLVEFTNLIKGAEYFVNRGSKEYTVTIPTTASGSYAFPSFIGRA